MFKLKSSNIVKSKYQLQKHYKESNYHSVYLMYFDTFYTSENNEKIELTIFPAYVKFKRNINNKLHIKIISSKVDNNITYWKYHTVTTSFNECEMEIEI